jgi:hypothetical protein
MQQSHFPFSGNALPGVHGTDSGIGPPCPGPVNDRNAGSTGPFDGDGPDHWENAWIDLGGEA